MAMPEEEEPQVEADDPKEWTVVNLEIHVHSQPEAAAAASVSSPREGVKEVKGIKKRMYERQMPNLYDIG